MRIFLGGIFAVMVAALLPHAAFAWGEMRVTTTDVNVRAARRADAPKIVTLKKGQRVKVDFIKSKWAAIFPEDTEVRDEKFAVGYASIRYLQLIGPVPDAVPTEPVAVVVKPEAVMPEPVVSEPAEPTIITAIPTKPKEPNLLVSQSDNEVVAKVRGHVDDAQKGQAEDEKPPVKITSDRMVYNESKGTVVFEGTVRADHQGLVLFSDTLTAYFSKGAKKGSGADQIDRIVAKGGVKVTRGTTHGQCSTLTYMVKTGVLLMEGNPILEDGDNTITGQVIKFYMKDNRSEVVGGKGKRVQAVFSAPNNVEP